MQPSQIDDRISENSMSRGTPIQSTMTGMIQRELEDFGMRDQRRVKIVSRLIFLQIALLLMMTPITFFPHLNLPSLITIGTGFVLFATAWIRNISKHTRNAQWMLVIGSGIVTTANVAVQMLAHPNQILQPGLASFPFMLTIIEAGLLFTPELVLITAVITTTITTIFFFVALGNSATLSTTDTYLLAVISLGLQALIGMISWQVSHFIQDFSAELAQVRRDEFIATQYEVLRRAMDEQASVLRQQVITIVQSIFALSRNDFSVRPMIADGDLRPIAEAVSILAQRMAAISGSEQAQSNLTNIAAYITDLASEMSEGDGQQGIATNQPYTASPNVSMMQSAMLALQRARASSQRRLMQVRDTAMAIMQKIMLMEKKVADTSKNVDETQANIGLLRSKADSVYNSAVQLNALLEEMRLLLAPLLPSEVSLDQTGQINEPGSTVELQQLHAGNTVQLDSLDDLASNAYPHDQSLHVNLPDPMLQSALREMWSKLVRLTEEAASNVRDSVVLQDKLGVNSRSIRQLDLDLSEILTALAEVRQFTEQLYGITQSSTSPLTGPLTGPLTNTGMPTQRPTRTNSRPLSQGPVTPSGSMPKVPGNPSEQQPAQRAFTPPFISLPLTPQQTPIVPGMPGEHPSRPIQPNLSQPIPPAQNPPSRPHPPVDGEQTPPINIADLIDEDLR